MRGRNLLLLRSSHTVPVRSDLRYFPHRCWYEVPVQRNDYERAWRIMLAWNDEQSRAVEFAALGSSSRRPYVVIAMIRFGAILCSFVDSSETFAEQIRQTSYAGMEEGILHLTDQIFQAIQGKAPDLVARLDDVVDLFAGQEPTRTDELQPAPGHAIQQATTQSLQPAKQARILPGTGKRLRIDEAPLFARVRVTKLGSLDTESRDYELLGETVIIWTDNERSNDIFAEVEVRGILRPENEVAWTIGDLSWLSGDAEVEIIDPPRYAGQPEELIKEAQPVKGPTNPGRRDDWPPLIWRCEALLRALEPLDGNLSCVDTILCALSVAPPTFDVRPWLLAGLKARYAALLRDGDLWPEKYFYWRYMDGPPEEKWRHM